VPAERPRARYGAGGLACGVIALPVANYTRTHHMCFLRGAGVIRVRAKGTGRITRPRGDDLYPGLLDAVLAAQHQMARPATMPDDTPAPTRHYST
jgi:hypothetical protein